jgi:hypothetical protein
MAKNLVDMLKRLMFNKMGDKLSEIWDFVFRFLTSFEMTVLTVMRGEGEAAKPPLPPHSLCD